MSGVEAALDWSVRACIRRRKRRQQEKARARNGGEGGHERQEPAGGRRRRVRKSGQTHGTRTRAPEEATHPDWHIRGARPWTGTSGKEAAMDWSVQGQGCKRRRTRRRQETARRTSTRARKVEREDKKRKGREEGGEGDGRVGGKRMKPGEEDPGKTGARTGTTGWWRFWTGTSGVGAALDWSVRGCIRRKKQRRQGEHAQEQGTAERGNTKSRIREAGGEGEEGEADKRMEIGPEHLGHGGGVG